MTHDTATGPTTRDRVLVIAMAIGAMLLATPGVHLFERWLAPHPALYVSHGLALAGLGAAWWQWRSRSRRR